MGENITQEMHKHQILLSVATKMLTFAGNNYEAYVETLAFSDCTVL